MTAEGENEMVAQTAKLLFHATHFCVFRLILEESKNLCTWGMTH